MKDAIITVAATVALCVLFSLCGTSGFRPALNGYGTRLPGESGQVLPGAGSTPADPAGGTSAEAPRALSRAQQAHPGETSPETNERKEQYTMHDILIAFWHGVATVLIGETCALAVAAAWLKMKTKELKQHDS